MNKDIKPSLPKTNGIPEKKKPKVMVAKKGNYLVYKKSS